MYGNMGNSGSAVVYLYALDEEIICLPDIDQSQALLHFGVSQ